MIIGWLFRFICTSLSTASRVPNVRMLVVHIIIHILFHLQIHRNNMHLNIIPEGILYMVFKILVFIIL